MSLRRENIRCFQMGNCNLGPNSIKSAIAILMQYPCLHNCCHAHVSENWKHYLLFLPKPFCHFVYNGKGMFRFVLLLEYCNVVSLNWDPYYCSTFIRIMVVNKFLTTQEQQQLELTFVQMHLIMVSID